MAMVGSSELPSDLFAERTMWSPGFTGPISNTSRCDCDATPEKCEVPSDLILSWPAEPKSPPAGLATLSVSGLCVPQEEAAKTASMPQRIGRLHIRTIGFKTHRLPVWKRRPSPSSIVRDRARVKATQWTDGQEALNGKALLE